jgi:hypothetical protein
MFVLDSNYKRGHDGRAVNGPTARAERLVKEWAATYAHELLDMSNRQEFRQLPGLE